jgi:two-component system, OmpR family, response regulator RegX3
MRIALLEDDPTQSLVISTWLRNAGHDVHTFSLSRALQRFAARESVDLFVLDWMVPDMTGTAFLKWLREERQNQTPAIFVTSRESEDDIVAGLAAGADDYLVKPVKQRILLARIDAVMRRYNTADTESPPEVSPYMIEIGGKRIRLGAEELSVTEKEFDLALFLFRNVGRLLSRGHLLEAVWGRNPDLATRTVDTHISRVRSKLRLRPENGFRLMPTYNFGYRLERTAELEAEPEAETA